MMRSSIRKACCLVAGVVLLVPMGAAAQSIEMTNSEFLVRDAAGTITGSWTNGDDMNLGGSGVAGRDGTLRLRNAASGSRVITLDGIDADAIFGGGNEDGDIILRDTDGTTTTISLDGGFGLIQLGSPNDDGDLRLWDENPDNELSIVLNGSSGNVSNQLAGNGLVKAWARINSNGTVASCYRCNASSVATGNLSTGQYEVSFSPLGTDIRSRPRLATLDVHNTSFTGGQISLANRGSDNTSVFVLTLNSGGASSNEAFTIIIF